jgi:transposase-like protein
MKMETRDTVVTDQAGMAVLAKVVACPKCGNDAFNIFIVGEKHQHLQCTKCQESFCDGSCNQ